MPVGTWDSLALLKESGISTPSQHSSLSFPQFISVFKDFSGVLQCWDGEGQIPGKGSHGMLHWGWGKWGWICPVDPGSCPVGGLGWVLGCIWDGFGILGWV